MNNEQQWWYGFDPVSFEYTGMRLSAEKPENATDIKFDGISNPTWNTAKNSWEGDNIEDKLAKLREQAETGDKADNTPIAGLTSVVADLQDTVNTSVSSLMVQVAQLQDKLDVTPVPTDVAVDTTNADSATVTTEQEE